MSTSTYTLPLAFHLPEGTLQMKVQSSAVATTHNDHFSIRDIQFRVRACSGDLLSYKQVRDALYRLRVRYGEFCHVCRGSYRWM